MTAPELEQHTLHGRGRLMWTIVNGTSMYPTLLPGERVLIDTAAAANELVRDDIVVFRCGDGRNLIHRYCARDGADMLICRGDNSMVFDTPWKDDCLLGRLVAVETVHGEWMRPRHWSGRIARLLKQLYRRDLGTLPHRLIRPLMLERANSRSSAASAWEMQELGDERIFYNPTTGELQMLNVTASIIWSAIREKKTTPEILEKLRTEFPSVPLPELERDVRHTIAEFERLRL